MTVNQTVTLATLTVNEQTVMLAVEGRDRVLLGGPHGPGSATGFQSPAALSAILDAYGDGFWNSGSGDRLYDDGALANGLYGSPLLYYVEGYPATGYYEATFYVSGNPTSLDSNGDGWWDSDNDSTSEFYDNGYLFTGTYSGLFYVNGLLFGSGWYSGTGTWYHESVATTLDSNGDGNWDGSDWIGGVRQ